MQTLRFDGIDIYASVYEYLNSNMYVILSQNEALVIDPHVNGELETLLSGHGIKSVTVILTHEHCDHISGVWWFLENFDCKLICSESCAKKIADKRHNRPLLLLFIIEEDDKKNGTNRLGQFKKEYVLAAYNADITYADDFRCSWQGHELYFKAVQGHSVGGSFIVLDGKYVFTGDSLLKDYPIIISFPHGSKDVFLRQTLPLFEKSLRPDMTILPGHGDPFLLSDIMVDGKICVEMR